MKKRYGVLVVDDSALMRKIIAERIESCAELFVSGKARNGTDALEKIKKLQPDVVTLDMEMPGLNGIDALKQIMAECPVPVVMLSNGEASTVEAYAFGAVDFIVKEALVADESEQSIASFHERLQTAAQAKLPEQIQTAEDAPVESEGMTAGYESECPDFTGTKQLIVIGSSTGGPSALQRILTKFPRSFSVPIVVIQHMPPGFTKSLATRFDSLCELHVKEAEHNEPLRAGTVYIAPAGWQMTLKKPKQGHYMAQITPTANIDTLYKPSVDVALLSAAPLARDALLAVVLTGMGEDGLRGCHEVKKTGGTVLSESEETCIVYGMPKVVYAAGLSDKQVPIDDMYKTIMAAL